MRIFKSVQFLLCLVLLSLAIPAEAQISFAGANINSIPESKIKEEAEKLNKSGMTLDEFEKVCRSRGASSVQANQLRRRVSKYYKSKPSAKPSAAPAPAVTNSAAEALSKRPAIQFTHADSVVFGFDIFTKATFNSEPSTNMVVGEGYIVGAGDMVDIDIYGSAEQSYSLSVTNDGSIIIPMLGAVKVAGLTLEQMRTHVTNKLKSIYRDLGSTAKASVRISSSKLVAISVMGEVYYPGTYQMSSSSTVFHALYMSGGPTRNGTMRDVMLIRGGKVINHLDVYDVIIDGNTASNVSLVDGDIVMVSPYLKRVHMEGAFKHPGDFEAKEGETLKDMFRFAGGFADNAMTEHISLVRVGKYNTEMVDVQDPASVTIASGDRITVPNVDARRLDKHLRISGSVFAPGFYFFTPGTKLSDLIKMAGGLKEDALLTRGVITRRAPDYTFEVLTFNVSDVVSGKSDIELHDQDHAVITSLNDVRQAPYVTITGAINYPAVFDYRENMTLGDLVVLADGFKRTSNYASIEIVRRLSQAEAAKNPTKAAEIITVSVHPELPIDDAGSSFKLQPFDEVIVRELPNAFLGGVVTLQGAVTTPGGYGLESNGSRLSELIARCGGLSESANVYGAKVYRPIRLSDIERNIRIRQSYGREDTLFYLKEADPYDVIAIDLKAALEKPKSEADVVLRNGDILAIPEMDNSVRVSGLVQSPASLVWNEKWNAKDYVEFAGGFSPNGHKKKTYVVYPNGQSASVRHFLFFRRYPKVTPGSEVVVPQKPESNFSPERVIGMSSSLVSIAVLVVTLVLTTRNND